MRLARINRRREPRRWWRTAAAIGFGGSAAVFAIWTGAYWAAALNPIDATAGQLLAASAATAGLSAVCGSCSWVAVRPRHVAGSAGAALLAALAAASFLLNMR